MIDLYDDLSSYAAVERDIPLSKMTTLRIGGIAKYVVYPEHDVALDSILRLIKENDVPYKVLGKGSDLLCSDDPFDGVIIRLDRHFNDVYFDDETVTAQAGASIIALSVEAMKKGLSGLEFASGIPGTVGGAVYMNAGAYRSDMSAVLKEIQIYRSGSISWIPAEACEFSYRSSIFQKHPDWIILAARLQLTKGDPKEIAGLMENRRERRLASQPLDHPSCGSVFRNLPDKNAWELIDGIGYRGKRKGDVVVSEKHCNFILNTGNAKAQDYLDIINEIKEKVREKYGVELHKEVEMFNWK